MSIHAQAIAIVERWLDNADSVSTPELKTNRSNAYYAYGLVIGKGDSQHERLYLLAYSASLHAHKAVVNMAPNTPPNPAYIVRCRAIAQQSVNDYRDSE